MKVRILFFASVREAVGCREMEMEIPEGTSAGDLKTRLVGMYPDLAGIQQSISLAVNAEYVGEEKILHQDDDVAFIPPVSGG